MLSGNYIPASLTRIANLEETGFELRSISRELWRRGDYVVIEVNEKGSSLLLERPDGRQMEVMSRDRIIGALGVRHATLEFTGTWKEIKEGGPIHVLTGAGLLGSMTSKSAFLPDPIEGYYLGHVLKGGKPANMQHFVPEIPRRPFRMPVVLLVGTSMSAGKTTAARVLVRQLKESGMRVAGAKLTGAGRYKDILAMKDAGADQVFDFVDVGLPSSIAPPSVYLPAVNNILSLLTETNADVAVVEIGASPLEPYNGEIAIREVRDNVCFTVLCASDPYAVLGVMEGYNGFRPNIISGPASNTLAGRELVEKLCGVRALNILEQSHRCELKERLRYSLKVKTP